jgi:outer membrane immunogenic protein
MKKILLGTTMFAGLLMAGAAQAADMPLKAGPRAEPVYSSWAGFYLGIHGGYGWGDVNFDFDPDPFHNPRPRGGLVGGHAGYLWQWSNWVGGLEIDYSAASLKQDQSALVEEGEIIITATLSSKIDALGSARARLGWLWTPNLLAYGTAGVGWARSKLTSCFIDDCVSSAESSFGWVAGAGLEYQFANNWRLRAEYLHYDFGTVTYFGDTNADLRVDVVRGALSFKF